jgi:hypothetical protein
MGEIYKIYKNMFVSKHVVNIHAYMGTLTVEKCLRSYKLFDKMEINTP